MFTPSPQPSLSSKFVITVIFNQIKICEYRPSNVVYLIVWSIASKVKKKKEYREN